MGQLHDLTAVEQVSALRAGKLSAVELTDHYVARIDRHDEALGAFITVTPDLARAQAVAADQQLRASGSDDVPPLFGLPLGIKDLHSTAGVRTTFGCAVLSELVPTEDAWTVGLLRQAGIVLLGKTNAPEFGPTCYTDNDVLGRPAVTPYDLGRYASGSSGGAAAAVAAGLMPVGHASDGAGSARTPAAVCHLVGVKPSRGLVSMAPAVSYLSTSTEGPVARTVADAALLLDVMAQPPPEELHAWRPSGSFAAAARRDPSGPLRVAVWTSTGLDGVQPSDEAVLAVKNTCVLLEGLGHHVEEVPIPAGYDEQVREAMSTWFASAVTAGVTRIVPDAERPRLRPYTQWLVEQGERLSAVQVVTAHAVLAAYAGRFLRATAGFDLALTPTTSGPPVPLGEFFLDGPGGEADRMLAWSCYTPWVNLSGQPAVSLPLHLGGDGLPYGVQLIGPPRADEQLISIAGQLERAAPWHGVHPTVWTC